MEEIILKKVSVFKTRIEYTELLDAVNLFAEKNEENFKTKEWQKIYKTDYNCFNSTEYTKNIIYDAPELFPLAKKLEDKVCELLKNTHNKYVPFMIYFSWINIMKKYGYQEFHKHDQQGGSGVLYLSDENSEIEFSVFPENSRKRVKPKKGDLLLFEGTTFHRVLESQTEKRVSLAFNFYLSPK